MAMYYQGSSEIQAADTLQTLYLMNPNYLGYSDSTKSQPNMLFFNSSAAATNATTVHGLNSAHHVPHAPPHFVGLPQENIQAPRFQYNIWNSIDQSANVNQTNTPQALSLSLSAAAHRTGGGGFGKPVPASDQQDFPAMQTQFSPRNCSSLSHATTDSSGGNTMQSVIMGSKYLRAAQELLDEVANVGKGNKNDRTPAEGFKDKAKRIKENPNCTNSAAEGGGGESGNKNRGGAELTTAQRQEIQMKKAKLSNMLDEVEQRYRQYHHQMQIVVASFEQAAGTGSAKSYTQLALKTILKQFRCLKSTISAEIKALSRSLGEEEIIFGEKILEGSRVRFVDYQRRALQQLGMMHNNTNAWRPQRGLPERAVSVLRAWLFDHFLHPYPKDSDKHMLAKQTGLTRSQVSNWFINARVRLWKPMVEEMYLEEMKSTTQEQIITNSNNHDHHNSTKSAGPDNELLNSNFNPGRRQEINSNDDDETARIDNHLNAALQSHHQRKLLLNLTENISSASNSPTGRPRSTFAHLITSMNVMENLPEKITKKPRNEAPHDDNINSPSTIISGADTLQEKLTIVTKNDMEKEAARENYLSNTSTFGSIGDHQLGRFSVNHQQMSSTGLNFQDSNNNNNFSLSLGLLPPSETSHQQNFNLSRRNFEFGTRIDESGGVESNVMMNNQAAAGYEILDFQINRKPFPAQLLPADFVA